MNPNFKKKRKKMEMKLLIKVKRRKRKKRLMKKQKIVRSLKNLNKMLTEILKNILTGILEIQSFDIHKNNILRQLYLIFD